MLSVVEYLKKVSDSRLEVLPDPCGCITLNRGMDAEFTPIMCPYHVGRFDGVTLVLDNPERFGLRKADA